MKSTGIVMKIDELGRIVLPIEMRRTLGISDRERIEIYVDGENIILKKHVVEKPSKRGKKYICAVCQREIDAAEIQDGRARPRRAPADRPDADDE